MTKNIVERYRNALIHLSMRNDLSNRQKLQRVRKVMKLDIPGEVYGMLQSAAEVYCERAIELE